MTKRHLGWGLFAIAGGILLLATGAAAQDIPATPEAGSFRMGIEPWLGYGPWQIAAKKGFFAQHGLKDVQIVNFTQDKDINAALASGQLDGSNIATHTALAMVAAGLKIKVVMLEDLSMAADAILAGKDIGSIADLKGKQVAFEQGTTSDILLNYALQKSGMSMKDVTPVPMPASDAGGALIAGRVPVAVTYEPYISIARGQNKDLKLLFTAGEDPGLISDVFVVSEAALKARPGQIAALLRAWNDAVAFYGQNAKEGQAIISESVGAKPEELETAFAGVKFYSLAENKAELQGDFAKKTIGDVEQAAIKAGILTGPVDTSGLIDPRFVDAAAK